MPVSKNRKKRNNKQQIVFSEPRKIFVETYLTPKGQKLIKKTKSKVQKQLVNLKYQKNRYKTNPYAKPVRTIFHF